jgi:hypothetical protein
MEVWMDGEVGSNPGFGIAGPLRERQIRDIERVLLLLKDAQTLAARANCPKTMQKIRSAINSATGALGSVMRRRDIKSLE